MPVKQKDELDITFKFGGGLNTSASEDEINDRECSSGQNFTLDYQNRNLKNRAPFDLIGQAPNGGEIRGWANHIAEDGTVTALIQAGDTVYQWSESSGFVSKGSVNSNARLRGTLDSYWSLEDKTIITDLELREVVLEWDGATLSTMTHNLTGDFKAKYCLVDDERARYANVISNSTATPHMVVTSKLSDHNNLSVSDRPSSSLGADDPYFLLTPDLRPINGIVSAFGITAVSSEMGRMHKVTGNDSTDTAIQKFFPRSYASGDESTVFVGNDILYGRIGRIESLASTDAFGDVKTDDLSVQIESIIEDLKNWTLVYNPRTQKVYAHATGQEFILELNKPLVGEVSPWSKLVTAHPIQMNPTCLFVLVDPDDGIEYTFMGDASGNLYKLEGTGQGDGGSANVKTIWRSKLFTLPRGMESFDYEGSVSYRSLTDETITIKVLFAGSNVTDASSPVTLKGTPGELFWGGTNYWGEDKYWGVPFSGRFRTESFTPEGGSESFQIQVEHEGAGQIEIRQIEFRFTGAV